MSNQALNPNEPIISIGIDFDDESKTYSAKMIVSNLDSEAMANSMAEIFRKTFCGGEVSSSS